MLEEAHEAVEGATDLTPPSVSSVTASERREEEEVVDVVARPPDVAQVPVDDGSIFDITRDTHDGQRVSNAEELSGPNADDVSTGGAEPPQERAAVPQTLSLEHPPPLPSPPRDAPSHDAALVEDTPNVDDELAPTGGDVDKSPAPIVEVEGHDAEARDAIASPSNTTARTRSDENADTVPNVGEKEGRRSRSSGSRKDKSGSRSSDRSSTGARTRRESSSKSRGHRATAAEAVPGDRDKENESVHSKKEKKAKKEKLDKHKERSRSGTQTPRPFAERPRTSDEAPLLSDSEPVGAGGAKGGQKRLSRTAGMSASGGDPPAKQAGPEMLIVVTDASPLTPNPNIVHPFVRVWLVDGVNGTPLVSSAARIPYISTFPFDLRSRQSAAPAWNDSLRLPINPDLAACTSAMLLFEVLDFGNTTISGVPDDDRHGLFEISWGFLRLCDHYGRSNGDRELSVQLFRYPDRWNPLMRSCLGCIPSFCAHPALEASSGLMPVGSSPRVFYVFQDRVSRCIKYPAALRVRFSTDPHVVLGAPPPHECESAFERRLRAVLDPSESVAVAVSGSTVKQERQSADASSDGAPAASALQDFRRKRGERSLPPNTELHRATVESQVTAMTFSPCGALLAVATMSAFTARVRVYDVFRPRLTAVATLTGHVSFIHSVRFSRSSSRLLSCSADGTARVWSLDPARLPINDDVDSDRALLLAAPHSAPMYSGVFHDHYIVVAGYDTRLFIWNVDSSKCVGAIPNGSASFFLSVVTDADESKLWTVDSAGMLLMWRPVVDAHSNELTWSVRQRLQCRGASSIQLVTSGSDGYGILPCPGEGVVTVVELSTFTLLRNIQVPRGELGSVALLSDSRVMIAGMSSGRLSAWEVTSGLPCTAAEGADAARIDFPIERIVWNPVRHVCAVASVLQAGAHGAPRSTHLRIVGRPRPADDDVVQEADPKASEIIRVLFGAPARILAGGAGGGGSGGGGGARGTNPLRSRSAIYSGTSPNFEPVADERVSRWDRMVKFWQDVVDHRRKARRQRGT